MNAAIDILVVEDNPLDLELTLRGFEMARLANRIEVARDGEEALQCVFCEGAWAERRIEDAPRLILLDLKLPKVDGLEVLARIKGDARTRHIPVVMLTSSQEQVDLVRSYALGVNSYIVKPVSFENFVRAVQELGVYWMMFNAPPPPPGAAASV
jgi:two-component system, response regulator